MSNYLIHMITNIKREKGAGPTRCCWGGGTGVQAPGEGHRLALSFLCDTVGTSVSHGSSRKLGSCEVAAAGAPRQCALPLGARAFGAVLSGDFWETEVTFFIHVEKYSFISIGATVNK